jgi:isoleucyl-tRNA synthetase
MQPQEKNYKHTLNLPKTDFSMKAQLAEKEPRLIAFWEKLDLYTALRRQRKDRPLFILHDGPPYANGDIHIGHALNKTLKDIVVKYKTLKNFNTPFTPGWDCHGLPVEHQLFKKLNIKKDEIAQNDFRKKAHDYALEYVALQSSQFKRLGVFADWRAPYLTLDPGYEAQVLRAFAVLVKKGFIYRDLKPVNWCAVCETALAEAEVEYADHSSPSVYVKFAVKDARFGEGRQFLVIWTTTPWTLVANVAVAVHPQRRYVAIKTDEAVYVVMQDLLEAVARTFNFKEYAVVGTFTGKELEGLRYAHPFLPREGTVVLADYVSHEEGTGCVHTAPGHGMEDYLTGQKYNLAMVMPVTEKGVFDATAGEFSGMHVFKANDAIIAHLRHIGALLHSEKVSHSYPHCWRCKTPIIFRATKQWFLKIDHDDLRKKTIDVIEKKVQWIPSSGKERISSMVTSRPDWCLSRQRYWGVPIPSVTCQACKKDVLDPALLENVAAVVEKEGSDAWFAKELSYFMKTPRCPHCASDKVRKHNDILDVWFESGASYRAVLMKQDPRYYPADLYLEGSDQHRGWFQSTLLISMGSEARAAFKSVLTHGFVVDGEGRKMSKSLGNVVSPQDVIEKLGADVLRLWVASCDYREDIKISREILDRLVEAYRKIRNTLRFIIGNLYDFDHKKDALQHDALLDLDRWMLGEFAALLGDIDTYYAQYEFHKVVKEVYEFCVIRLSSFYLDILKDRLYTSRFDSRERRSAQTVLSLIGKNLAIVLSPILSFTGEEFWQHMPGRECDSVHMALWPDPASYPTRDEKHDFARLVAIREAVLKALELQRQAQNIGSSLDASLSIYTKDKALFTLLERRKKELASLFIVSDVTVENAAAPEGAFQDDAHGIAVTVARAQGTKCLRCWNIRPEVGTHREFPGLCRRCVDALQ